MKTSYEKKLFLAGESGGTKALWYLLNEKGVIREAFQSPGIASVREKILPVKQTVKNAVDALLDKKGLKPEIIKICYMSLGGPNTGEIRQALSSLLPGAEIIVDREANGNLLMKCAEIFHFDVAVLVGTGTVAVGEMNGQRYFAGGWGPDLDDLGSGYWLGLNAIRAVLLSLEGRGGPTSLVEDFKVFLNGTDINDFSSRMELKKRLCSLGRHDVAAFAEAVCRRQSTDPIANKLICQAAEDIARMVFSIISKWPRPDRDVVVLGLGGIFLSGGNFSALCHEKLTALCNYAQFRTDPVFTLGLGACIMALKAAAISDLDKAIPVLCDFFRSK